MPPFEKEIQFQDNEIRKLRAFHGFKVKKPVPKNADGTTTQSVSKWHSFNIIPCVDEGYKEIDDLVWEIRMHTYMAANGNGADFIRLLNDCTYLEIWQILLLNKAYNW